MVVQSLLVQIKVLTCLILLFVRGVTGLFISIFFIQAIHLTWTQIAEKKNMSKYVPECHLFLVKCPFLMLRSRSLNYIFRV